jgi:ABC-type xylose transport system permease subunit
VTIWICSLANEHVGDVKIPTQVIEYNQHFFPGGLANQIEIFKSNQIIFICTESENRRRSQGVACRCHRVIFFKWGTFGVILIYFRLFALFWKNEYIGLKWLLSHMFFVRHMFSYVLCFRRYMFSYLLCFRQSYVFVRHMFSSVIWFRINTFFQLVITNNLSTII